MTAFQGLLKTEPGSKTKETLAYANISQIKQITVEH